MTAAQFPGLSRRGFIGLAGAAAAGVALTAAQKRDGRERARKTRPRGGREGGIERPELGARSGLLPERGPRLRRVSVAHNAWGSHGQKRDGRERAKTRPVGGWEAGIERSIFCPRLAWPRGEGTADQRVASPCGGRAVDLRNAQSHAEPGRPGLGVRLRCAISSRGAAPGRRGAGGPR
ncbi:twin-arginine translocation signal domain-containing protein [Nocardia xishanensis]